MTQSIKPKTFESMIEVKLKYSSATGSLVDEYESLKVERREMLDRIKVMIERTDFMLSHHKTRKASSS